MYLFFFAVLTKKSQSTTLFINFALFIILYYIENSPGLTIAPGCEGGSIGCSHLFCCNVWLKQRKNWNYQSSVIYSDNTNSHINDSQYNPIQAIKNETVSIEAIVTACQNIRFILYYTRECEKNSP